jgi:NADH dehydrogenase [ubiquinone] 1 alpha subcomplex assembly factor 7
MAALSERIAALIAAQGPISVAQFMTLALHDAQAGYYAIRDPFGRAGDFITAPEISQMFGEMLGLWLGQVWMDQGAPKNTHLVELGPGRGTLMADALRVLKRVPGFCEQVEIVLVEASPALREFQKARLADSGARLRWTAHFDLGEVPLLLIANEFFDALPIRQYVKTGRGWCERMVVAKDGALDFALAPQATLAAAIPASRAGAPDGGVYEASPAATALIAEIARIISTQGGAALLLDYGYAHTGFAETLQAVRNHQPSPVLADPGASDISAHVDFAALAESARQHGATVSGPKGQGAFLEALGIGTRARKLAEANPAETDKIMGAIDRLTAPSEMGTLFQAMALSPSAAPPLPGF